MVHFVTGATGLVGNNLVRLLLARGEKVRVLARPASDARPLAGLDLEVVRGDVTDADCVRAACRDAKVVLHAAGHVHIGWTQSEAAHRVNVEGTRNVVAGCLENQARLVHVSSINALGVGRRNRPANEEEYDPRIVLCPYVTSKRAADEVVEEGIRRGLNAAIVYPSLMFGPWDWKPTSGRMILQVAEHFTPLAPWGGTSVADVRDIAEAILATVKLAPIGRGYVLGGANLLYLKLWRLIAQITGGQAPYFRPGPIIRHIGGYGGDVWRMLSGSEPQLNSAAVRMADQYHFFDSSRAVKELGYRIRPIEETLRDAWHWLRENGFAN
jgi:dihydroflavonol-4-reductase